MGKMGSFGVKGMKQLQKELEQVQKQILLWMESCIKELAARLLAKVVKRTPVGAGVYEVIRGPEGQITKYQKGKRKGKVKLEKLRNGGVLRRGWTSQTQKEAESGKGNLTGGNLVAYANGLAVEQIGTEYRISIINPVEYTSYVEYGHRQKPGQYVPVLGKRLKKSWTPGIFMMTISEQEIQKTAPQLLEKKIQKFLGDAWK